MASNTESSRLLASSENKKVEVVITTGSNSQNVEGLIQLIRKDMGDVVKSVRFEPLPYNISDMNKFDFSEVDVLILCHSIENRRFSLTDVTDALYDKFLPRARRYLGKSKMCVIAHDFPSEYLSSDKLANFMNSFRRTQGTTFDNASLVLVGSKLSETPVGLNEDQINELKWFFHNAASPSFGEVVKESTKLLASDASGKRVDVVVTTCSNSRNVEGLIQLIQTEMCDVVKSVRFEPLPYNISGMNNFDFRGIDVLILCHSIENRRLTLTDVTDALYDEFLPRARRSLGKSKTGVIAHDFPREFLSTPVKRANLMNSFRRTQGTTFDNSSLVLTGSKLSKNEVGLNEEQINELKWFLYKAASPPSFEVTIRRFFCCCTCLDDISVNRNKDKIL